ncbi:unnamed protein product [Rotaria socialis]|uniref:BTB domain-containing protein n=2 Tax=Rotaria socialis TaxID=392032 RepID=A0A818YNW1_9BILA|nr:unnamed protein product [Rotaria socialis]
MSAEKKEEKEKKPHTSCYSPSLSYANIYRMTATQCLSISSNRNIFNGNNDIITFNIGGHIYSTRRSTINENLDSQSYLSLIVKNQTKIQLDNNGHYFIDRDGKYFCYILNYFREKKLILPENFNELKQLFSEAKFYQIDGLINEIENHLNKTNETNKEYHRGFQFTLISNLEKNGKILKLIGPLKLITFFHIKLIGEKFLNIISSFKNPQDILCQLSFSFDENLIACQPIDQLQRFVLTKQARKMNLIVSYCDDYFYIPTERDIMSRHEFTQILLQMHNGKLLDSNIKHDDSQSLVEHWFLPTEFDEAFECKQK